MTAAFILSTNMSLIGIFAIAFAVVAAMNRDACGVRWIALGYAMGIAYLALEYLQTTQVDPTPVGVSIFLVFLLSQSFCMIGVARHYGVAPPWIAMAAIWSLTILAVPVVFSLVYGSPLRSILYQAPYIAMQLLFAVLVWRSQRRQPLDMLFLALQLGVALLYLAKPLIAAIVGTARSPQGYMDTAYAAISQSASVVLLVAIALVLLLVIMRDTAAEMVARSETDVLSGLLNRRGFDARAEDALARALRLGEPAVLIAADLDHFKAINDSFGHAAGDDVIAAFARLLRDHMPPGAIVSRLGGEEFAVFVTGATLAEARGLAEAVRTAFAATSFAHLGITRAVTASFGVAQLAAGDGLLTLSRRADAALYRAKARGRNRVGTMLSELAPMQPAGVAAG
ncbi:GGDEF domain-containing protein [Sphingopyxis sp. OPL5]|uniref:GGDEF domain-containing protein n=1 Tax=Sphingopyxis sp. OPL5 TaxID=2486273 RepID=UPI00164D3B65|nr:GGDEF domain-containing protein [Sphingopyxis sp. OPL5]QNO26425.1 GGDEF domain-containing protein [Sphingopyxis sp. OPL5]